MAFKKMLAQRLFTLSSRVSNPALIKNCRISSPCSAAKSASLNRAPDPGDDGIFRRYLHRSTSSSSTSSDVRFLPTGEKLLEKLREMDIARERIRFDGLIAPAPDPAPETEITVSDAKKILKLSQMETVKAKLRLIEKDSVSYGEYLEICAKECESVDLGFEIGKMLDQSGVVIVLGSVVFLRPEKEKLKQTMFRTPDPIRTRW